MKNTSIFLAFLVSVLLISCSKKTDVFVSSQGSDQGSGTINNPFLTVQRAIDFVREHREKGENKTYNILIREGRYFFDQTIELTEQDSNIKITPYNNENVCFSGGISIDPELVMPVLCTENENLFPEKNRAAISMIQLKKNAITDYGELRSVGFGRPVAPAWMEVFINSESYHLARWPNDSFVEMGEVIKTGSILSKGDSSNIGGEFKYVVDHPSKWENTNNIWLFGYFNYGWADDALELAKIDSKKKTFATVHSNRHGFKSGKPFNRWYAYNIAAEIDTVGEYYIDRNEGILYFFNPDTIKSIEVSMLEVPLINMKAASNIIVDGITIGYTRGGAVEMTGTSNCIFSDCIFKNIGCYAVGIYNDEENSIPSSNNGVENCIISNTGAGGVLLFGGNRQTLEAAGNYISNCTINNFNRIYKTYCSGVKIAGVGNRISHNEIFNSPHAAIILKGNDHTIEYNDIHDVCLDTDDVGAFYYGRNPSERGNVLRYNYFHHIGGDRFRSAGIYHDDGACDLEVIGNILYKAGSFASQIGGGCDNVYANNIFIDNNIGIKIDDRFLSYDWAIPMLQKGGIIEQRLDAINYNQPPYSVRYPELVNYWDENPVQPKRNVFENNVFVNTGQLICENKKNLLILPDNNLITIDDPGFVDKKNEIFELKESSDFFKKLPGFKQIPFGKIGVSN